MIINDKEKKNDNRINDYSKKRISTTKGRQVMEPVQQFSDYGVRIGDAVEYRIPGIDESISEYVRGYISELREDGIRVRFYTNGEYKTEANLPKSLFDEFKLEIFDENRGCDDSAIGLSGCFEPWRRMWF